MILAIDSATRVIGLALHDGEQVQAECMWLAGRRHTVNLAPELALMMRRVGVKLDDLTGIAVASGPGSYTGLRIGIALAKGLAMTHHLPLAGIPTLDILAAAQPKMKLPMIAVIEAGRQRIAAVWYKYGRMGWKADAEPENLSWSTLIDRIDKKSYICGEIASTKRAQLSDLDLVDLAPPSLCVRRPAILAELGRQRLLKKKGTGPAELVPTYLGLTDGNSE